MALIFHKCKHLPKNLLIVRTDRLGDFMQGIPSFEAAKKLGISSVTVLCHESNSLLLEDSPYVDSVLSISDHEDMDRISQRILSMNFDAILVLVNDTFAKNLLPRLKKIPIRIGPINKITYLKYFNYPVVQKRSLSLHNEAWYNIELLKVFGLKPEFDIKPKLYFSSNDRNDFLAYLEELKLDKIDWKRTVVIHAGMKGSALNWSIKNYERLLSLLVENEMTILLSGYGNEEKAVNETLFKTVKEHSNKIFDLSNCFTLKQLAFLFSKVKLFIGPSTGTTHLAASVGAQIIAIYPPIKVQSVKRWEPYLNDGVVFSPDVICEEKYKCKRNNCEYYPCMDTITPQAVNSLAEKMIINKNKNNSESK